MTSLQSRRSSGILLHPTSLPGSFGVGDVGEEARAFVDSSKRPGLKLFDVICVGHFRGFAACWEVPAGANTATNGQWMETPGRELFATLQKTLGDLPIIAENLGIITPDVESFAG